MSVSDIRPGLVPSASGRVTSVPVELVKTLVEAVYPKFVSTFTSAPEAIPANLTASASAIRPPVVPVISAIGLVYVGAAPV